MAGFLGRASELAALEQWWDDGGGVAAVWGRRRVGKTALADRFARGKRAVFHAGAGRGDTGELALLTERAAGALPGRRAASGRYPSWAEALDHLRSVATSEPVLLVLDDFSELLAPGSELAGALRAFDRDPVGRTQLKVLLCGASVRRMEALCRRGGALHGLADTTIVLEPFGPREAAAMLDRLEPADRARVYGIVGGLPLYLAWWDQDRDIEANLAELVCRPGAPLLTEGDLLLAADLDDLGFNDRVLHALAAGHTSYNDVRDRTGTEPARPLDRLIDLRLIERVLPVGENRQARRRRYRIVDPFVRFHLAAVARHRPEIDRGRTDDLPATLAAAAEDAMGDIWVEAFRGHVRALAAAGELPVPGEVVGVGPWWDNTGLAEIDVLALAGRAGAPVLAGAVTWDPVADAGAEVNALRVKVERGLGAYPDQLRYAVCARDEVRNVAYDVLSYTAADLFGPP